MPEQQYALFKRYTRKWLHRKTGFSLEYLSRLATGRARMNPSFIERVCFKLNKSKEELFRKI